MAQADPSYITIASIPPAERARITRSTAASATATAAGPLLHLVS